MNVAETILNQLGGNKFLAMTGAKGLGGWDTGLQFSLPARFAKNGIRRVRIELTPADLYNVTFYKSKRERVAPCVTIPGFIEVERHEMIYADQLQPLFTQATGLDTHL